jgi:hypothetical protein
MAYVAASAVTGMSVQVLSQGGTPNSDCARFLIYGTYTAADFYLRFGATVNTTTGAETTAGIAFKPGKVVVINTTQNTMGIWYLDDTTNLANSGFTVVGSTGAYTAVAKGSAGVSMDGGKLQFDVSACCPITDNDECIIELYRG